MSDDTFDMTEDQVLAYTQRKYKHVVETLTAEGKLPEDKADKTMMMSALDGLSRVALTKLRIKSDEKIGDKTAAASAIMAQLLINGGNIYREGNNERRDIPMLPSDIPDPALVPGETEINARQLNYNDFTRASD